MVDGSLGLEEIAELSAAIETNAYDLHLSTARRTKDAAACKVFGALAKKEADHIERMLKLFARP